MISGLSLLDKPVGISSFFALKDVKRVASTKKVGHAGTLDPFASGLLIALSGSMTKLVPLFMDMTKEYRAVVRFGVETDTLDPTGTCIREAAVPDESVALEAAESFTGEIDQIPPAYSALKVNGRRLYSLAREGKEVQPKKRRVEIMSLDVLAWDPPDLDLRIVCSKGTYIRSLARDIGVAAGSAASVFALRRTGIGDFTVDEAVEPGDLEELSILTGPDMFSRLEGISCVSVVSAYEARVLNGESIRREWFADDPPVDGLFAMFGDRKRFLAVARAQEGTFSYSFVANRLD